LTHQAPKIGSMQSVRGVPRATNGQKVVTLLDEDRSEAYATLDETRGGGNRRAFQSKRLSRAA